MPSPPTSPGARPDRRPPTLTLTQALKITLFYYRHDLTEELLAEIFNTSQPTISRTINTVEKALKKALKPLEQSLENSLKIPGSLVIDGTLIPTWNWRSLGKTNFSGKHKRAGFNHQVICTLGGNCWPSLTRCPVLGMEGYIGLGLSTPRRRYSTCRTPSDVKVVNRFINSRRAVVERVITQIKTWRILHTGFRQPLGSYGRVFSVVQGFVFLAAGGTFE